MKEELTTKLVEILTSIQTATGKASDFALEQLPEIAQSYVLYGRVSGTLYLALFIAIAVFSIRKIYEISRNPKIDGGSWSDGTLAQIFAFSFSLLIAFICFICTFSNVVMAWVAPKVWLLQALATLMK